MQPKDMWPLFGLTLRTKRLELRLPQDGELAELCSVALSGIHPPEHMPFLVPWTDRQRPEFERGFAQHHWLCRATWRPDDWKFNLAVRLRGGGQLIGSQTMVGRDFAIMRTVDTGSWLASSHQRRGFGREMREAVLAFSFDHLGAEHATSEAMATSVGSIAVSRGLGYAETPSRSRVRDVAVDSLRFRLAAQDWRARRVGDAAVDLEVEGLAPCRSLFGARPG